MHFSVLNSEAVCSEHGFTSSPLCPPLLRICSGWQRTIGSGRCNTVMMNPVGSQSYSFVKKIAESVCSCIVMQGFVVRNYLLQIRIASEYRLRYREPKGCDPEDCDYFVGIDTNTGNSSFLDFYLIGRARGWVAVGLAMAPAMVSWAAIVASQPSWNIYNSFYR